MCVGLSAKVVRKDKDGIIVDSGGAKRRVRDDLLMDLRPGDYVMVHAGAAISRITETDSKEAASVWESFK
ncbi:HypC/HybG/HupF family hydrogenase formation chaperone [Candidatus Weimeria sp. HCP3S3_B5]|uniref:HypC/HybG/HupF family hydrogenase formation chaperone n=1 Tax=Candidatus Weimeria sp. HCP3S3_B5 TaxID=3438871 RepID=UPI002A9EAB59|nr:HypC/HybG/HupF family hydrogenase formation chaperone [Lachnospiraceae bacterium]MDY6351520.1 HypC/HybG/HupF family hydrogenase formation chaperone [Lachnospiraceae bacterium]